VTTTCVKLDDVVAQAPRHLASLFSGLHLSPAMVAPPPFAETKKVGILDE
jgi:hypothetical protein